MAENAFTLGLSFARKPSTATTTTEPQRNERWREDRWKWSIITTSAPLRQEITGMLVSFAGKGYGPTTRYFADRDMQVIDVPFEVVKAIFESEHEDFIVMNKISKGQQWSISKNYTKGDLSTYFGARFHGTYQTTGKKKPPQKVRS